MHIRTIRVLSIFTVVVTILPIAGAVVFDNSSNTTAKRVEEVSGPDRMGYTAITTQEFKETYPEAELIIVSPNGSTVHVNSEYSTYFDVDPVPGSPNVVEYVATNHLRGEECDATDTCTQEVFVRENFVTGESEILWSRISPGQHSTRIHDIDRINESHVVVADIYTDTVFIYNLDREVRTWSWSVQRDYPISGGGPFPSDWTHVNDVELVDENIIMVSLRNQDSVVFLSTNGTLLEERTLGHDGQHNTLYEQHNPDYIDSSNPGVIVADSENNRVIEYEMQNNSWEATWRWNDDQLQWPRDADRLPNGNTLITDSNGDRVLEINQSGDIVWSVEVGLPYEAERLSTGAESHNGPAATEADLRSRTGSLQSREETSESSLPSVNGLILSFLPDKIIQAVAFVTPRWMGFQEVGLSFILLFNLVIWGIFELRHSSWQLRLPLDKSEK